MSFFSTFCGSRSFLSGNLVSTASELPTEFITTTQRDNMAKTFSATPVLSVTTLMPISVLMCLLLLVYRVWKICERCEKFNIRETRFPPPP